MTRICGVYEIRCKINNKIYVGSSNDINYRWKSHKRMLNATSHFSPHLQSAWNKYKEENFEFIILEECIPSNRIKREQFYLDLLKPYSFETGYNTTKVAGKPLGTGRPITLVSPNGDIVHGLNSKEVSLKYGIPRCIISSILLKKRKHYKGWCLPGIKVKYIPPLFKLKFVDGNIHIFENIKHFTYTNNLKYQCVIRVLSGRIKNHKGWCLPNNNNILYSVEDPFGKKYTFNNISYFAKENNLRYDSMVRLIGKQIKTHNGWKLI